MLKTIWETAFVSLFLGDTKLVIANILSLLGVICLAIGALPKTKKGILYWDAADCAFAAASGFLVGSTSAITLGIGGIRNIVNAKGKMTKPLMIAFASAIFILGIVFNKRGLIGFFPPIAATQYTLWTALAKKVQLVRMGILINVTMWFVHDAAMRLYPYAIADLVTMIILIVKLISDYRKGNKIFVKQVDTELAST